MSSSLVGPAIDVGADREGDDVDDRDDRVGREADQQPIHDSPHRAGGHHNRRMTDVLDPDRLAPHDSAKLLRAAPGGDAARAAVRPRLRGRGRAGVAEPASPDQRRPRRPGRPVVPDGVLRDLVGVDELHLVRLGLRHRRLALPGDDDHPDGRRARARGRRPRGHGRLRLPHRSPGATSSCGSRWSGSGCGRRHPTPNRGRPRCGSPSESASSRCCGWHACTCSTSRGSSGRFFVLVAAELAVPVWAESHRRTSWHPHHIAERFGLFTLLLLGESLLASANAMIDALGEGEHIPELLALAACGLVVTAGIWWLYFAREQHGRLGSLRVRLHVRLSALRDLRGRGCRLGRRRGRDRRDHRAHRDLARGRRARAHAPDRAVRAERVGDPAAADAVAAGVGRRRAAARS